MTAITFPRAWPDALTPVAVSFMPEPMLETTPLRSGKVIGKLLGPTLWRATYESQCCTEADFGALRAWYSTLLSLERFYAYDVLREYPLLYPNGFGAFEGFDGTCSLDDVTTNKLVDLADLPEGLILSPGDYIAFDYGSGPSRALHMIVAGDTADSNGDMTVEVRPFVRTGWEADATVYLHKPSAQMIVRPGTWQERVEGHRYGKISFEAVQTL